jgi:O-antigen/teichoic acid export membrane protein
LNTHKPTRLLKNSTIYALGDILRNVVSFVMLPIYTRYLTPSDYGVVGLIAFAVAIFEAVLGAKLIQAIPKFFHDEKTETGKNAVISTAFLVTGGISLVTVSMLFLLRHSISEVLFDDAKLGLIVGLCALQILAQTLEYYALLYLRLVDRPITFIAINIAKLILQLSLNIWLIVFLKMGVLGVAVSGLASSTIFAVALSAMVLYKIRVRFNTELAKRMLIFSWPLWFSGLASLYIFASNRYYIRLFDSLDSVGLYELAAKFAGVLALLIWSPFSLYWQTEQFRIIKQTNAQAIFETVFQFLCAMLAIAGLAISIFSAPLIKIMASIDFWGSAQAIPLLIAAGIFSYLADLSNVSFLERGETGWLSKNNFITAITVTVLYLTLTPKFSYVGAAAALALSQLIRLLIINSVAKKREGVYAQLGAPALMALIFGAGYISANNLFAHPNFWLDLAVKFLVLLISVLLIGVILWRNPACRQQLTEAINKLKESTLKLSRQPQ